MTANERITHDSKRNKTKNRTAGPHRAAKKLLCVIILLLLVIFLLYAGGTGLRMTGCDPFGVLEDIKESSCEKRGDIALGVLQPQKNTGGIFGCGS